MPRNQPIQKTSIKSQNKISPSINLSEENESQLHDDNSYQIQHSQIPNPLLINSPYNFDTDVEKFRIRLEDLLNRFKLDSMTEIIETKKNILLDQQKYITAERMNKNEAINDINKEVRLKVGDGKGRIRSS